MNTALPPVLILALLCGAPALAQKTLTDLRKNDRPVFLSAADLAEDCRTFLAVFPDGKPLPDDKQSAVSISQITGAVRCTAYILGVQDGELERSYGTHYHPVSTRLPPLKPLIDTFLKYLSDHPEQQGFAASTILDKAMELVANAETPVKNNRH